MTDSSTAPPVNFTLPRAESLDALRGAAILLMALQGLVPYGVLPGWMYHAQVPPPDHVHDPTIPGITWVDWIFPFFLFSMGAAIPLALSARLARGDSIPRVTFLIIRRGALLGAFAIIFQHFRPHQFANPPTATEWALGLLGFVVLAAIYVRLPQDWPIRRRFMIRILGWGSAVALLATLTYADGGGFRLARSDIIIVVLANTVVAGSIIWLLTRKRPAWRLAVLAILLFCRLVHEHAAWAQALWDYSPAPWIYRFAYLQYLFVVIPGTVAGDVLHHALTRSRPAAPSIAGIGTVVALVGAIAAVTTGGLYARRLPGTIACVAVLAVVTVFAARRAFGSNLPIRSFILQGLSWLVLGLMTDGYEGGIKKDPSTLSYYFVTTGLALLVLAAMHAALLCKPGRRALTLLIDTGQNPMLAYAAITLILAPAAALSGLNSLLAQFLRPPWWACWGAVLKTLLLALFVAFLTRRRWILRT